MYHCIYQNITKRSYTEYKKTKISPFIKMCLYRIPFFKKHILFLRDVVYDATHTISLSHL